MYDWAQKAVDAIHLAGNGVGFGLPDWLATQGRRVVDGEDAKTAAANVAANTARAKDNLGVAGDVITGAGQLYGGARAAGAALGAIRALPGLVAGAAEAPVAGNAFRAGIQAMNPSPLAVAARAITPANTLKAAGGALGITLAAGLANANRTGLADPVSSAIASSSPIAGGPSYAELSKKTDAANAGSVAPIAVTSNPGGLGDVPADGPQNAFAHILDNFSAAQGGLSLHQLASLAQSQAHSRSPLYGYQKKPQTAVDKAGEQLNAVNDAMWEKASKEIDAMPAGKEKNAAYAKELAAHQLRLENAAKINTQQAAMGAMLGGAPPAMAD